jgi:hypothetical protein
MSRATYFVPIVAGLLGGCVAHDWTCAGASGAAVDARSGKPLAGVSVYRKSDAGLKLISTTGADGRFVAPPNAKFYVTIPMGDAFYRCELLFRTPGYRDETLDCSSPIGAYREVKLPTTVRLHRQI